MPAYNWQQYNNYRSGDLSPADGTAAPDLTLEGFVCQAMCLEEAMLVWINVGNEGASPLTAGATLSIYGKTGMDETLLVSQPFVDILPAGQYAEAIGFQVNGIGYDQLIVRSVANEEECKLDNNELTFETPFCGAPG